MPETSLYVGAPGTNQTASGAFNDVYAANHYNILKSEVVVEGLKIYVKAASSLLGKTVTLNLWSTGFVAGTGARLTAATRSVVVTNLVEGWNVGRFVTDYSTTLNQRVSAGYRHTLAAGSIVSQVSGLAVGAISEANGTYQLSAGTEPAATGPDRLIYGFQTGAVWTDDFDNNVSAPIDLIVSYPAAKGPQRLIPAAGKPVGITAGTVAAGNDSRLPYRDTAALIRPRVERVEWQFSGAATAGLDLSKRRSFSDCSIAKVIIGASAFAGGASVTIDVTLDGSSIIGGPQLRNSLTELVVNGPLAMSSAGVLNFVITAVTGTVSGPYGIVWLEYA